MLLQNYGNGSFDYAQDDKTKEGIVLKVFRVNLRLRGKLRVGVLSDATIWQTINYLCLKLISVGEAPFDRICVHLRQRSFAYMNLQFLIW